MTFSHYLVTSSPLSMKVLISALLSGTPILRLPPFENELEIQAHVECRTKLYFFKVLSLGISKEEANK
jgi:hypothetical protein